MVNKNKLLYHIIRKILPIRLFEIAVKYKIQVHKDYQCNQVLVKNNKFFQNKFQEQILIIFINKDVQQTLKEQIIRVICKKADENITNKKLNFLIYLFLKLIICIYIYLY